MNALQQFKNLFKNEKRGVAKIASINADGSYNALTAGAHFAVKLKGKGYTSGQTVFYNVYTGQILDTAPNLDITELNV